MVLSEKSNRLSEVTRHPIDGSNDLYKFELNNGNIAIEVSNYGCTIISINTPDLNGQMANIVAGLKNVSDYTKDHPYLGCIVGRYANRIAYGKCRIAGLEYVLTVNDGKNHLHGGFNGFNRKTWKIEKEINEPHRCGVQFSYASEEGEEGYPGNLNVVITYFLTDSDELVMHYEAVTDKPTIVNLTNHSYFNLSGFQTPNIYDHLLKVNADSFTEKNQNNVPTGTLKRVADTVYDFLQFKAVGEQINRIQDDKGYDINYVLNGDSVSAQLYDPFSGRLLTVLTDRPGMQLYTANWWDGTLKGSHKIPYLQHAAIALETQAFPDGPNHPHFPGTVLYPGEVFKTETILQFTAVQKETIISRKDP